MNSPRVDVVFPCLNEAQALPWVLSRLPAGYRAIVVDNASTDATAAAISEIPSKKSVLSEYTWYSHSTS